MVLHQNRTSIKFRNEENVRQPQILTLYIGQWGRGMGHMGNGVQGYGTHGQLGTGVWSKGVWGHMYGQ